MDGEKGKNFAEEKNQGVLTEELRRLRGKE